MFDSTRDAVLNAIAEQYEVPRDSIEVIETHISEVFLTPRYVLKRKKPVRLDFLDFSTLSLREAACREELVINRRLAPQVYLDVVRLEFVTHESGPSEDVFVLMNRLEAGRCLEQLIQAGNVRSTDIDQIVDMLVPFYESLQPVRPSDYVERFRSHIVDNKRVLEAHEPTLSEEVVGRAESAQLQFLFFEASLLKERVSLGRVADGHGDLRAEHIYLTEPPVCIDGIEFNQEFRIVDVADELAFLAISCEVIGRGDIGEEILTRCLSRLRDDVSTRLIHFYRAYRASVRAKVAAIRADQLDEDAKRMAFNEATRYLEMADRDCRGFHVPRCFIMRGVSGSGKSSVAKLLSKGLGMQRLSTDAIRQRLAFESDDRYVDSNRDSVYQRMFAEAEALLDRDESLILDATFLKQEHLLAASRMCERRSVPVWVLECECPRDVAAQRIEARSRRNDSDSEASVDVLDEQLSRWELIPEALRCIRLDLSKELDEVIQSLESQIA